MWEAVLGVPREGGGRRHLSQRECGWPFQALEKKGISHLEEKELKEKERREKREKDEKEKAEKQRLKEERRKERQEALECVPCPLHLGSHTLCSVPLSPYPTPSMGISTGLGQQVSLSVMSRRAKLEEKRKKEEEKRLREEEKVECVSRSRTFPCV